MALPPGVPLLLDQAIADLFGDVGNLMSADTYIGYGAGAPAQWGLFLDGAPVVLADTVVDLGYQQSWAIADYPVERGGFESYDKVNTPFAIPLRFATGGSEAKRQSMLDSVAAIADSLTLYDVVTPEAIYIGVNVESYNYRRTAQNGLGLMVIDMRVIEIREEGTTDFKNTKGPSAYAAEQRGNIQSPTVPTPLPSGVQ